MFGLNGFQRIPTDVISQASQASAPGRLHAVIEALMNFELLSLHAKGLALTAKGKLRNAEIMFYLAETESVLWKRDDPEFELIRRYEFFPDVSKDNQILFEKQLEARVHGEIVAA
jgi:hypothetical protein